MCYKQMAPEDKKLMERLMLWTVIAMDIGVRLHMHIDTGHMNGVPHSMTRCQSSTSKGNQLI